MTLPNISESELKRQDTSYIQRDSLLLVKVSRNGDIKWMKEYPLLNKTSFWHLNDFSKFDSRFAILGSYSIKGLSNRFKNVVIIFNDDGDIKYTKIWSSITYSTVIPTALLNIGDNLYLSGTSEDSLSPKKLFLTALVPEYTSVKENKEIVDNELVISPNPATDYITLNPEAAEAKLIQIYSIEGIKMYDGEYSERIDVSGFARGVYFVKIGNKVGRFVKI